MCSICCLCICCASSYFCMWAEFSCTGCACLGTSLCYPNVIVLSFSLLQVEAVLFDPEGAKPAQRTVVSLLDRHRECFAELLAFYKEIEQIYQTDKKKAKKGSKKSAGAHADQPPPKQRKASGSGKGRGKGEGSGKGKVESIADGVDSE